MPWERRKSSNRSRCAWAVGSGSLPWNWASCSWCREMTLSWSGSGGPQLGQVNTSVPAGSACNASAGASNGCSDGCSGCSASSTVSAFSVALLMYRPPDPHQQLVQVLPGQWLWWGDKACLFERRMHLPDVANQEPHGPHMSVVAVLQFTDPILMPGVLRLHLMEPCLCCSSVGP